MHVIDAHTHLGECRVFDVATSEHDLIENMDKYHIDVSLTQPYPGAPSATDTHDCIASLTKTHSRRFYGIASINPHQDSQVYFNELSRCVKDLGFVGVKLHTIGHAIHPAGVDATTVFESAQQLNIPVMMHTGPGIPFAAPSAVTSQLKKFPQVPVILAHAGHGIFSEEAIAVAQTANTVYLEPSWCAFYHIDAMINAIGSNRVMFGSDLPANIPTMMASIRSIGLTKEDEEMVMGGTAQEVFKLVI